MLICFDVKSKYWFLCILQYVTNMCCKQSSPFVRTKWCFHGSQFENNPQMMPFQIYGHQAKYNYYLQVSWYLILSAYSNGQHFQFKLSSSKMTTITALVTVWIPCLTGSPPMLIAHHLPSQYHHQHTPRQTNTTQCVYQMK